MSNIALRLAALAALHLVAGAWTDPPTDLKTRVHSIAIVSVLGDRLSEGSIVLDGADFDRAAYAVMARTVRDDIPGVVVVAVDLPHDALVERANADGFGDAGLERVRKDLEPWLAKVPVDYVLVLLPTAGELGSYSSRSYTDHFVAFGLSVYGGQLSVLLEAAVIDGKTGKVVANMRARAFGERMDAASWKALAHPTPELDARLADSFTTLIRAVVPGLVQSAGL